MKDATIRLEKSPWTCWNVGASKVDQKTEVKVGSGKAVSPLRYENPE